MGAFQVVVMCEKPSQARTFASAFNLNKTERKNGYPVAYYDRDGGMCVVHLSGHLLELEEPKYYEPSLGNGWNMDCLPVLPPGERWKLTPKKAPNRKEQGRINALVAGIKWAMVDCGDPGEIAIAVDNDKEGELLGWEMLEYFKLIGHKNLTRLLYSQVHEDAMRKAFDERFNAGEMYTRYLSGLARLYGDWMFGMNVTMGLTLRNSEMIPPNTALNSGRVIYSISYLIFLRDQKIKNYVPRDFYNEIVSFQSVDGAGFEGKLIYPEQAMEEHDDEKRLFNQDHATKYHNYILKFKEGDVIRADKENKKTSPPLGFHRTGLDRHLIRKHGMSLEVIAKVLQVLYDTKGLITYPRVDIKYLDAEMHSQMPPYIAAMCKNMMSSPMLTEKEKEKYGKIFKFVDPERKTAIWKKGIAEGESHHAIIPTAQVVDMSSLTKDEFCIYKELVDRMIVQFLPDYEYSSTAIEIQIGRVVCKTSGTIPLRRGWKAVAQDMEDDGGDDDDAGDLPNLSVGDKVSILGSNTKTSVTKEPKKYTTDELLGDLENPKKFVENKGLLKKIKKLQIGTDGTRQDHVSGLVSKGFATFEKKKKGGDVITPTLKLLSLMETAPSYFKTPEVSAYWENAFEEIKDGSLTLVEFLERMRNFIKRYFSELNTGKYDLNGPIASGTKNCLENKCGGNLFFIDNKRKKFKYWACSRCKSAFFDEKGNVGSKMVPGKKKEKWVPEEGAKSKKCTSCKKDTAYHKKIEGKSWSIWQCVSCDSAFFDEKGELGKKMGKKK